MSQNLSVLIRSDMVSVATPPYMTAVKKGKRDGERKAFVVADLETLITGEENTHKPYATGLMLGLPKEPVKYNRVETYFSEDYNITINSFDERSSKVLEDFVSRIEHIAKGFRPALTIYFHNLGRFDGPFLLKHLTSNWKGEVRTIMRNNRIYEISVKSGKRVYSVFATR